MNSWSVFEISLLYASSDISGVPENAVSMQKIEYETFDHRNQSSMASGSLFYPEGVASAPLLSWQHGTVCLDADAPSFGTSFDVAAATSKLVPNEGASASRQTVPCCQLNNGADATPSG